VAAAIPMKRPSVAERDRDHGVEVAEHSKRDHAHPAGPSRIPSGMYTMTGAVAGRSPSAARVWNRPVVRSSRSRIKYFSSANDPVFRAALHRKSSAPPAACR
jgi:hypothetical protein